MKKLLTLALLSVGLLTACNDPITAWKDPNVPPQVSITEYGLQWKLRVVDPLAVAHVGNGQLQVKMQVYNTTNDDLTIDSKCTFLDKAGVPIENSDALGWQHERIPPRGYETLTFTSMSTAADDFRILLRPGDR